MLVLVWLILINIGVAACDDDDNDGNVGSDQHNKANAKNKMKEEVEFALPR